MSKFKLKNDAEALEKATKDYELLKEIAPTKQSPDTMQTPSEHLEDIQNLKSS
ncbi:MAG: hypothetical protein HWD61_10215 [Parachlamydiaceae bacterium]|nr:MAG: hypothetical protein HWD61_10215 [Parachlamydiaceae bacterium]